jgi:hypothetical protein
MAGRSKDRQITLFLSCCDSSSSAPLLSRASGAYVNLHKLPIRGTSLAESLNMRNLTRFLWLGIARLMGKNTRKDDKTISYQTLRYRKGLDTNFAAPAIVEQSLHNSGIRFEIVERVKKRDDDLPSARDLQIYKLEREVAELKDDRKNLNDKLTRCLAMLTDDLRAIRLGLHQGQCGNLRPSLKPTLSISKL